MTKISNTNAYPFDTSLSGNEYLVGTEPAGSPQNQTKSYKLNDLRNYMVGGIQAGPAGPQGIQGNTGPAGPIGPVGPAGLNWQGAWVSGTEYFQNDAVGYNGASWFLYTASNAGSENESPEDNPGNWALLASQGAQGPAGATGAQGPQGAQGVQGAQGPAGDPNYNCWRAVIDSSSVVNVLVDEISFTSPVITNPSNGKILITKTGFFTSINPNKIDLITATVNNAGTPYVCTLERYDLFPNDSLILNVFDMSGAQTGTPSTNFTVEIRVYN